MATIRKQFDSVIEKSDDASKPVVVRISSETVDRAGDVIRLSGWDFSNYLNNPIVLLQHDHSQIVGKASKLWVEDGFVKASVEFAPTTLGQDTEKLVRGGFLSAASVGFMPVEYAPRKDSRGLEFTKQELHEFSFVSVPCNQDALVESKSAREELFKNLPSDEPKDSAPIEAAVTEPLVAAPAANSEEAQMDETTVKALNEKIEALEKKLAEPVTANAPAIHLKRVEKFDKCREEREAATDALQGKGLDVARMAIAKAHSGKHGMPVVEAVAELGYVRLADDLTAKSLNETTGANGGFLAPDKPSSDFVELLRPMTIARSQGCPVLRFQGQSTTMPKQTGASTAYFVGEESAATASDLAFGTLNIAPKQMAVEVLITNQLLRDASSNVAMIVRDDMLQQSALKEDLTIFEGAGTEGVPKGIIGWAGNSVAATGSPDLAKAKADLNKLKYYLESNNVTLDGAIYVGNPRHFYGLEGYVDAVGGYPFETQMEKGNLNRLPFAKSGQLSVTGAASRFYICKFAHAMIGENSNVEVVEDTTYTSGGTTYSASAKNMTVLRLWRGFDFVVRQANAFAFLSTCTWGA